MRKRNFTAAAVAALIFAGGFGVANGFGDRTPAAPGGFTDVGSPEMELTAGDSAQASAKGKKKKGNKKSNRQTVTHLITTRGVAAEPDESVFVKLQCRVPGGKKTVNKGEPISGGVVLPADPGLELTANSHFNPNDLSTEKGAHFVAVRNTGTTAATFLGTVACLNKVVGG